MGNIYIYSYDEDMSEIGCQILRIYSIEEWKKKSYKYMFENAFLSDYKHFLYITDNTSRIYSWIIFLFSFFRGK